jgi:hypothetical protein
MGLAAEAHVNMIRRNTWIALGVFAALLALAVFWDDIPLLSDAGEEELQIATPQSMPLLIFDPVSVESLRIKDNEGNTAIYRRADEGLWKMVAPEPVDPDKIAPGVVDQALYQMLGWQALSSIEAITELEAVGLAAPLYRITLFLQGAEDLHIDVGDQTVTGSGYYLRIDNQQPEIVATYSVESLLSLLKTPPLLFEGTDTP